jgi:myosin heavy subunit
MDDRKSSYSEDDESKEETLNVFQANPTELLGSPDLSQLVYLEMKNVLINCEYRYATTDMNGRTKAKCCYTSISTILLAINPYESLPIYGQDVIDAFHAAAKKGRLPQRPHPYGVSARAYMRMIQRKTNQSVIVCGESGAGKTETTKLLMRYLAMTAPTVSMESSIVEQQIIAASPILEAYGNAKTVMNNNSSRFGKFTKLLYNVPENSRDGYILGSYLETYLLEKSRVVFQSNNERNYHILYFLYSGLKNYYNTLSSQKTSTTPEMLLAEEYGILHDCSAYNYTNQGNCIQVPGLSDIERYKELEQSLTRMRIDTDLQKDLWQLTAGIFNLGNISFSKSNTDGYACVNMKKSQIYVETVARLWGISVDKLIARLTTASLKIPGNKKPILKKLSVVDANVNRDSIAKGIYENIFLWLCSRINAELFNDDSSSSSGSNSDNNNNNNSTNNNMYFIGILDVFGFENFWINSLEQFCINFTNEKLQEFFNYHIINSEQEEYIKEGVFWKPLDVPDNDLFMSMVEKKKSGFFALLDSACMAPQPDPEAFMQELLRNYQKHPCLKRVTKPGSGNARGKPKGWRKNKKRFSGFEITHFADTVAYDASNFLHKNMEAVHPDTAKMMTQSSKQLVKYIGGTQNFLDITTNKKNNNSSSSQRKRKKSKKKKSVTALFFSGIKTLMSNLKKTEPYFVRCLNPNQKKSSKIWDEKYVRHQLRCGGLVEALKVLKLGYPTRVLYSTLYERYHGQVQNPLIKNMNEEAFSTALLIAFDVDENDYELGLTKIFFKPAKAAILDTIMAKAGQPLTEEQNRKITEYIVKKRIKQMIGSCKAFLVLRKRVRLARAAKNFAYAGRVASLLGGTVCRHLVFARQNILERKKKEAVLQMQIFYRGYRQRTQHMQKVVQVREAVHVIWKSFKAQQQRLGLAEFLNAKVAETRALKARKAAEEAEAARILKLQNIRDEEQRQRDEKLDAERKIITERARATATATAKARAEAEANAVAQAKIAAEAAALKKLARIEAEEKAESKTVEPDAEEKLSEEPAEENEEKLLEKIALKKRKQQRVASQIARDRYEQEIADTKDKRHRKKLKIKEGEQRRRLQNEELSNDEYRSSSNNKHHRRRSKFNSSKRWKNRRRFSKYNNTEEPEDDAENDSAYYTEYTTDDGSGSGSGASMYDINEQLKDFPSIAKFGQLFSRHNSRKKSHKAQDRMIKISFDARHQPTEISWGGGSRHIYWKDILYVQWGFSTPVFAAKKDYLHLDEKLCFSVVAKDRILDLQSHTPEKSELWVKGIRRLLGHHNDDTADATAKDMFASGNLPGMHDTDDIPAKQLRAKKREMEKIARIQQDLFIMTMHTVFRVLDEERIWDIDNELRKEFNAKKMYAIALKKDIPWRHWNDWIREKITSYCVDNNRVVRYGPYPGPNNQNAIRMPRIHYHPNTSIIGHNVNHMHPQPQQHVHIRTNSSMSNVSHVSYPNVYRTIDSTLNAPFHNNIHLNRPYSMHPNANQNPYVVQPQPQPQPQGQQPPQRHSISGMNVRREIRPSQKSIRNQSAFASMWGAPNHMHHQPHNNNSNNNNNNMNHAKQPGGEACTLM